MIPPPAQRIMSERAGSTVVEVAGSHSVYVSQPAAVAELIEKPLPKHAPPYTKPTTGPPVRPWDYVQRFAVGRRGAPRWSRRLWPSSRLC